MKKPSVQLITNVINTTSLDYLYDIYKKDNSLNMFSKRAWYIITFFTFILFIFFLTISSIVFTLITVLFLCFSIYKISEIINYKKGTFDGLESGFESGEIYFGLKVLLNDKIELQFYNRLSRLLDSRYIDIDSTEYEIIKYLNQSGN